MIFSLLMLFLKSLYRLLPFIKPYLFKILAGFGFFFIARFFEISAFWLVAKGIDVIGDMLTGTAAEYTISQVSLAIVGCVISRFVFVTYARRAVRRASIGISFDLRQKLYAVVQQQGSDFFSRMGVGDIMTRAIQDIALVQRLISFGAFMFVIMVYAPFFAISFMLSKSVVLTLLILPCLPIIYFYARHVAADLAVTSRTMQDRLSDLASHTQENLSGIRTIQAQAQEENEIKRFWQTNNAYSAAFYAQARINSLMLAWMPFMAGAAQLLIIIYGGNLVLDGKMTVGDLVFFLACLSMLVQPIRMAGMFVTVVQRAAVATDRLFEIYTAVPEIKDQPSAAAPAQIKGDFEIRNLNYQYPRSATLVLKNVSFTISAGESIGIVGRVGSGKSTLLKQFTRMLNTERGKIFLDGHDICDYPLAQLRAQISQVLQDPFLFGEPLQDNISYDNPEREIDQVWGAAEAAALRETIEGLPAQMGTLVGERGVALSGGQKQRTTLARGLIRHSPVLILDDCFSSVDTETEEHILSRLKLMRANKTTLLVSHRISTLRHSDRIIVLDEGEIKEIGSHDELIRLGGIYAELEKVQTRGVRSSTETVASTNNSSAQQ
ncbi:MAG: ABC transporter ATP-binding protein/permease [Pseudomonadales bacterium]|nr:ABC transporter ATP-binding protein/permease [Pseudomonadales bacterium]